MIGFAKLFWAVRRIIALYAASVIYLGLLLGVLFFGGLNRFRTGTR